MELATRDITDFIGRYRLTRRIEDNAAGQALRVKGTAELRPEGGGVLYAEEGELALPSGQVMRSERQYLWSPVGGRIHVAFDDGRPFHDFDPVEGGHATEHLCGADMYRGGYDFRDWPRWSLTWDVSGPRKSYRSVTLFTPL